MHSNRSRKVLQLTLSVRRGASLFFPCPQRRSTELWAREFQRSSPGSFGKTTKLSWTLKYEKPLPTCLKFQLRPKTLVFGPPLSSFNFAVIFLATSEVRRACSFMFLFLFNNNERKRRSRARGTEVLGAWSGRVVVSDGKAVFE